MSHTKQIRCLPPGLSETLLTLLETLPGALFVVDDDARIVYANACTQAITEVPPEVLVGNGFWRSVPQLVSAALYQAMRKTKQTQEPGEVEYISPVTRNRLHVQLIPTAGKLVLYFHEKREALPRQQTFPPNPSLVADILENMYVGVGLLTPEGILLEINEAPLADAQIRREEVIGQPFAQTPWWSLYPTSQHQLCSAITRASRGETVRFETLVHPREGMDLHLEVTIIPHRDEDQNVEYLVYVGTDITARKRAEAEIHALVDAIPQLVWIRHPDGSIDSCNQRWYDYFGLSPEEARRGGWMQCIHPDDRESNRVQRQHALDTGEMFENEERLKNGQTGEYRWFLSRAVPVRNEAGQIIKWFGTCTDIDERKRMEEALRQSQERASALMNSNIIGIFIAEGEQVVDANDTFLRMVGYTREDLRAGRMNWKSMTPADYQDRTQQTHREMTARQSLTPYEKEYIRKDGSRLPVLVGGVVLQHHPCQAVIFVLDNSARKELEQRKDDFISMASHELRNPLTALKLQTSLLHKQLARLGMQSSATALARIDCQINAIARLVEELLDVSKIQAGGLAYVWEGVDLDELLRETVETMQNTHPSHRILLRGAARAWLIADRGRLAQVFTNLLSNAIKYSPDAETVEVDLSASEEAITVCVQDHGAGIAAEQRDKIFERFYRVADPRQRAVAGLGMGLYIVAEIVKGHGGTITVDSEIGKGSTFRVMLPRRENA